MWYDEELYLCDQVHKGFACTYPHKKSLIDFKDQITRVVGGTLCVRVGTRTVGLYSDDV